MRVSDLHRNTLNSESFRLLHERPRTNFNSDGGRLSSAHGLRDIVCKIHLPTGLRSAAKSRGYFTPVYYLWGDDRRAARVFVDANHDLVESCFQAPSDQVLTGLDDALVGLIKEEWDVRQYNDGEVDR